MNFEINFSFLKATNVTVEYISIIFQHERLLISQINKQGMKNLYIFEVCALKRNRKRVSNCIIELLKYISQKTFDIYLKDGEKTQNGFDGVN